MENRIIKLKSMELENFKNVKYGKIEFKEEKSTKEYDENIKIANILGIYGQNGSGKTSVINGLYLLKMVASGRSLNPSFCNYISCDENFASLNFEFRMNDKDKIYKVFYKFYIRKSYKSAAFEEYGYVDKKDETIEIFKEKLTYSKFEDNQWKKSITIVDYNMDDDDYTFRPIKNYREVANSTDKKVGFGIAKGLSQENSTSFIFNQKTYTLLIKSFSKNNQENSIILSFLRNFIVFNVFVIQNDVLGDISSNRSMPLNFMLGSDKVNMRGNIGLNLFDISVIEIDKLQRVEEILTQINVVLNTIIPKLKIEIKNYGKETLENSQEVFKVELLTVKNNRKIPLRYESDGIKKIISILSVLIGMYNNENILVAIDELDAGIFEYLLGEILEILSKSAKGQLIFTSHNLRALEKLHKDLVIFTTTNENNRYINLNNSKNDINLRDFYYRGIMLGGQREELYDETNKYEINYAFRKAWMVGNEES